MVWFSCVLGCMNLGRPCCRPRRQQHRANPHVDCRQDRRGRSPHASALHTTQALPQDLCSRDDREPIHELPPTNSSTRCASHFYPSETCMPAVVLRSLSCSQHSELLFLLQHHFFPCSSKSSPIAPLSRLRSAACILSSTCSSNSSLLVRLTPVSLGLGG